MRVNARFESQAEQQIEYITKNTGMGLSEVLRLGVDRLYQSIRSEQQHKLRHLGAWIGKGDGGGRGDVSANVKAHLLVGLEEKYGISTPKSVRPRVKTPAGKTPKRGAA